jgi:pyridoxal phosphate enzyme (YggS family)
MNQADSRRDELRDNLALVRSRIDQACGTAGRDPSEVHLIAVTKLFPASDAALLAELGVHDLGESRDQEASVKAAQVSELTTATVRWHFVGRLQSNKARSVAAYAHLVHSLDRSVLVEALSAARRRLGRGELEVLIQVSLDEDVDRGGVHPDGLAQLADQVADAEQLTLAGLMAVAPLNAAPDPAFERLAELAGQLRSQHPGATVLSAGMSGDFESAIRHGATHVRIGTALLGRRAPSFG